MCRRWRSLLTRRISCWRGCSQESGSCLSRQAAGNALRLPGSAHAKLCKESLQSICDDTNSLPPIPITWQVLWPRDVFNGGNRGCDTPLDAQLLRALAYAQYGFPAAPLTHGANAAEGTSPASSSGGSPGSHASVAHDEHAEAAQLLSVGAGLPAMAPRQPLRITLQRKSANRRLVNEAEVVAVLREFGQVRDDAMPRSGHMLSAVAAHTRGVWI